MSQLTEKDIKKGQFIRYCGTTSTGDWSCPAVIVKVDRRHRTFRVISLDDMVLQPPIYEFGITERSPDSRKSMRLVPVQEVRRYLAGMEEALKLSITRLQEEMHRAKKNLAMFRAGRRKLKLSSKK